MFQARAIDDADKREFYRELAQQLEALLEGERDAVANAANAAALIYLAMADVNWVGFYFLRGDELLLGPFQGKPACVRISVGQGVCGTAVRERKTIRVADVFSFAGHIACDADSRSEIVVPLISNGKPVAVMDIDSASPARFDADDQMGVERLAAVFVAATSL